QYEITVLAIRDDCESQPNANGNLDCVTNAAFVAWTTGEGALSYQGIAQAANGHTSGCNTTGSSCEIPDLKCGTRYNFSVTAFHDHCQSNSKSTFQLVTIHAEAHCTIDTILVRWENTEDSTVFVVSAEDTNHDFTYCNSTADTCILPNMFCGMEYSVIVSASSNRCSNLRSPPKKIKTPCVPSDVSVKQVCEGEGVVVTWAPSLVATLYELTAIDGQGNVFNCTNTESTCTFTDLHCGQDYGLTITATGDNCTSMPSESTSAILSW
uniref:Fibronectin type III domain containing 7b n=1 Tax=Cynoglossus semilaevis TaxID=244447 RepID=A0A3P8WUX6_CYNSE